MVNMQSGIGLPAPFMQPPWPNTLGAIAEVIERWNQNIPERVKE